MASIRHMPECTACDDHCETTKHVHTYNISDSLVYADTHVFDMEQRGYTSRSHVAGSMSHVSLQQTSYDASFQRIT